MSPSPSTPDRAELLICVYYRVAKADAGRATSRVRDFQRTLRERFAGLEAEVLVRCAVSPGEPPAAAATDSASNAPEAPAATDATLMETYRLPLSERADCPVNGGTLADAGARRFLRALADAAATLTPLQRGARHVELFTPCAS
jgi:hypothetical protein